ncbi:MAG TPA: DinB family protein [Terriglobales bacterium]|nr:DinB family protein [Terriglobales bacterium]
MSELEFIVDQIKRSFDGEAWHGPALNEILSGIDAITAAKRPVANAHSIWELVLHITAWERVIAERIITKKVITLSDAKNFPLIADATDSAWQQAAKDLRAAHQKLIEVASTLDAGRLDEQVPGKDYDIRFMLTGAAQHAAYHGGQIALLKKAAS